MFSAAGASNIGSPLHSSNVSSVATSGSYQCMKLGLVGSSVCSMGIGPWAAPTTMGTLRYFIRKRSKNSPSLPTSMVSSSAYSSLSAVVIMNCRVVMASVRGRPCPVSSIMVRAKLSSTLRRMSGVVLSFRPITAKT
jgi:hypothetical protein